MIFQEHTLFSFSETDEVMKQKLAVDYTMKNKSSAKRQRRASATKPRLGLTRRADLGTLQGFRLTERDSDIIKSVYAYRMLTTPQIEALLFQPDQGQDHSTKTTRCQYRLKLLYHAGYLVRDEQPQKLSEGRKPFVYFLDKKGADLVAELEGKFFKELDWDRNDNSVSQLFLDHLLATNDVRVAITTAAKNKNWVIERWLDDKTLKKSHMKDYVMIKGERGKLQRAAVVPDGYFLLNTGGYVYHHFLEIDRSTVTGMATESGRRDWARKVRAYLAYYWNKPKQYQKRYHAEGLRILTVTTGARRLAHLKEITEKVGGKSLFWFTTFDAITPATVLTGPIWNVAGMKEQRSLTW